jgi:hypothetical protein
MFASSNQQEILAFIVWSPGLDSLQDIVSFIRDDKNCKIVKLIRKEFANYSTFFDELYKDEGVDPNHIIAKTNFLKNARKEYAVILLNIKAPSKFNYFEYGKKLKWKIREIFNPSYPNLMCQVNPLPQGISHNHCVHFPDNIEQQDKLLSLSRLPLTRNLTAVYMQEKISGIPHHINEYLINTKTSLNEMQTKNLKITDASSLNTIQVTISPHYRYVCGDKIPYIDYHSKLAGFRLKEDHWPSSFEGLIKLFKTDPSNKIFKVPLIVSRQGIILDGAHRAAIFAAYNQDKPILCKVIQ